MKVHEVSSFRRFEDRSALMVKNSKKSKCSEPSTERHIPRDLSFGELNVWVKVKFTLEQTTKAQKGRRGTALLFPFPLRPPPRDSILRPYSP
jgi:hypothetical protein